jgi:hypothetical protein
MKSNYVRSKSSQFVIALTGHRKVTAANNGESTQRTTHNNCSFTAHGQVKVKVTWQLTEKSSSRYIASSRTAQKTLSYNYSIVELRV